MQNSEFAHFSSKSDKHMKQTPSPPFWGNVGWKSGFRFSIRALEVPFSGTWIWALLAHPSPHLVSGCVWAEPKGEEQDDIPGGDLRRQRHLHHRRQLGENLDGVSTRGCGGELQHPGMGHPHPGWWEDQHPGQRWDERGDQNVPPTEQGGLKTFPKLHLIHAGVLSSVAACGQEEEGISEFPGFPHRPGAGNKIIYLCSEKQNLFFLFLKGQCFNNVCTYMYVILHHNKMLSSPLGCSVAQMMVWFLCGTLELPGETLLPPPPPPGYIHH